MKKIIAMILFLTIAFSLESCSFSNIETSISADNQVAEEVFEEVNSAVNEPEETTVTESNDLQETALEENIDEQKDSEDNIVVQQPVATDNSDKQGYQSLEPETSKDDVSSFSDQVQESIAQEAPQNDYITADTDQETATYPIQESVNEEQSEETTSSQETSSSTVGPGNTTYVLNTNSKKFHYPDCGSVNKMKDENKEYTNLNREEIINMGYSPCGNCHP